MSSSMASTEVNPGVRIQHSWVSLCRSPLCVILRLCLRTRVFLRNLHCRSILTWLSRSCSSGICEADRANFEKKNEKEKRANPFSRRGQPQRDAPITLGADLWKESCRKFAVSVYLSWVEFQGTQIHIRFYWTNSGEDSLFSCCS